jgi:hypothetical protein
MTKNGKCLLGLGLLLASTAAMAAESDYLKLKKGTQQLLLSKDGPHTVSLQIETGQDIPMSGKAGAFGYAALSDSGNNVLVLTTHLPIDDSSHEAADSGFHTHVLDLKAPTPACGGANFEVDVDNSKKNAGFDAGYRWSIRGATLEIRDVPVSELGDAGIEGLAAFTLKPVLGTDGKPTNLCVTVIDQL